MKDVGGFVADLSVLQEAKKWSEDYLRLLLDTLETIHKDCQKPPIVLFLQGMDDETAEEASQGMLIEVSAGLIEPNGKRDGTASKRLVGDLIKGLRETVGHSDNLGRFASCVSVQLYLRSQVNYPVEIIQLWTRFGAIRDTEENLKERASQLAEAVRGLDDFESSQTRPVVTAKQTVPSSAQAQTDPLVEEAVAFINEKANETIYKGSLEIGNYVLEKFFAGDIARARDKNPKKKASYSALCRDERLIVSVKTLSVMVRVVAQEQFFNLSGLDTSGLCYTHKAELIRLPDDQVKLDLAKEAIESPLSTRQLSEKVDEACKQLSQKKIEIAVAILKNIENPRRIFEDSQIAPFVDDLKSLRKLSLEERRAISVEAKEMSKKTKEWMQKYDKLVRRLDKIDQ
jgi:hypothetical protein